MPLGLIGRTIVDGNHRSAATAWVEVITECTKYIHWGKMHAQECINRKIYDNNSTTHIKLILIKSSLMNIESSSNFLYLATVIRIYNTLPAGPRM